MTQGCVKDWGRQGWPPAGGRQAARKPGRLPVSNYRPFLPRLSCLYSCQEGWRVTASLFPSTSAPTPFSSPQARWRWGWGRAWGPAPGIQEERPQNSMFPEGAHAGGHGGEQRAGRGSAPPQARGFRGDGNRDPSHCLPPTCGFGSPSATQRPPQPP